jgi:CRISPR-associated Csx14 family protein
MSITFLATLGQAPEAITFSLDKLIHQGNRYEKIVILHTDKVHSKIKDAFERLMPILRTDYGGITVDSFQLANDNGTPLVDITDEVSAKVYFRSLGQALLKEKQNKNNLHLMVSGGRKAMSIYAMIAAGILMTPPRDKVFTVLSDEHLISQTNIWHIPAHEYQRVQLVELPFIPMRRIPNDDPSRYFEGQTFPNPHVEFIKNLTKEQYALAHTMMQYPYETNEKIAQRMSKSSRTLNNQLTEIYQKMNRYYGEEIPEGNRRIALIDIMREEE